MGQNTPDVTAPVRNRNQFIGVTGNMESGTGKADSSDAASIKFGGMANTSKGVKTTTGDNSFNNFPKDQARVESQGGAGGPGVKSVTSSSNPASIQDEVRIAKSVDTVEETTDNNISSAASGYRTDFPSSNVEVVQQEKGGFGGKGAEFEIHETNQLANQNGITHNRTHLVDDLTRIAEDERVVDDNSNKKVDGADSDRAATGARGSATPQERADLPAKVVASPAVDGDGELADL